MDAEAFRVPDRAIDRGGSKGTGKDLTGSGGKTATALLQRLCGDNLIPGATRRSPPSTPPWRPDGDPGADAGGADLLGREGKQRVAEGRLEAPGLPDGRLQARPHHLAGALVVEVGQDFLAGGELRALLQWAQRRFEELLAAPLAPSRRPPLRLPGVEPAQVPNHEPTPLRIRAENLPPEVKVFFAGQPAERVICRSAEGEIDVTAPAGLLGAVEVRVEDADDPDNGQAVKVQFTGAEVEKPYRLHVSGHLLRRRRAELKQTQQQVRNALSIPARYVSEMELDRGRIYQTDEVY